MTRLCRMCHPLKSRLRWSLLKFLPLAVLAAFTLSVSAAPVIADEWEWDPTSGYHEEEWYDPSDWFDPNTGIDYEDYYGSYYDGYDYDLYDEEQDFDNYGYNYYTSDWYDDEPDFDEWYEY